MTDTTDTTTRERRSASNIVILMVAGMPVKVFQPTEENKVPKRAARTFLESVGMDEDHELYDDLVNNRLELVSGHPETVEYATAPKLQIGDK